VSRRSTTWNRTRHLSPTLIGAIYVRDRGTCAYCGDACGDWFEIDHVRKAPRAWDRSDPRNLVIACPDCNRRKAEGRPPPSARAELRRRSRRVLDYAAGRVRGEQLYRWELVRKARKNARARRLRSADACSFDPSEWT
jgi:hypothetical protein